MTAAIIDRVVLRIVVGFPPAIVGFEERSRSEGSSLNCWPSLRVHNIGFFRRRVGNGFDKLGEVLGFVRFDVGMRVIRHFSYYINIFQDINCAMYYWILIAKNIG